MFLYREELPSGAKEAGEKGEIAGEYREKHTSGAKAHVDSIDHLPGINPWPTARTSFSAACKAQRFFAACAARDPEGTPVVPFYRALYETGCRRGFKAALRRGFLPAQVAGKEPPDYQTPSPRLPDFKPPTTRLPAPDYQTSSLKTR